MTKTLVQFNVEWDDTGCTTKAAPNAAYPQGIDVVTVPHMHVGPSCRVPLPYPAPRIGFYAVTCRNCGARVGLRTAGLADDPRSVTIGCKPAARH